MNDTVIKGTRNSRSILGGLDIPDDPAEAIALLKSTGWPIDLGQLNPLGCLQIGTPYDKQNVLSDDTAEFLGGDNSMTPNSAFKILAKFRLAAEYKTPGSYTFTAGADVTDVLAIVISGGGGGGLNSQNTTSGDRVIRLANGGNSGDMTFVFKSAKNKKIFNLVVGEGGAGVTGTIGTPKVEGGANGGSSSFDGITVDGGYGGNVSPVYSAYHLSNNVNGFQPQKDNDSFQDGQYAPFGGTIITPSTNGSSSYFQTSTANVISYTAYALLVMLLGRVVTHMSAGGSAKDYVWLYNGNYVSNRLGAEANHNYDDSGTMSPGGSAPANGSQPSAIAATPPKGTDIGCGGGAAVGGTGTCSGPGGDGAVFVFVQKGAAE